VQRKQSVIFSSHAPPSGGQGPPGHPSSEAGKMEAKAISNLVGDEPGDHVFATGMGVGKKGFSFTKPPPRLSVPVKEHFRLFNLWAFSQRKTTVEERGWGSFAFLSIYTTTCLYAFHISEGTREKG